MGSPAKDIAKLLEDGKVGRLGRKIFYGQMPEDKEPAVAVLDTGGVFANPLWKRDEFTIQVLVRGKPQDYEAGYKLAKDVKDVLLGCKPVTIDSIDYILFVMIGDITSLGYDEQKRPRFSLNFRIVKENEPGGTRLDF